MAKDNVSPLTALVLFYPLYPSLIQLRWHGTILGYRVWVGSARTINDLLLKFRLKNRRRRLKKLWVF